MYPLPPFDYIAPGSLQEACSFLAEHGDSATVKAGGTDLLPSLKQRSLKASYIVDLKNIEGLSFIEERSEDIVAIGPLTPLTALTESPVIRSRFPGLAQAADSVATPQIRNMGTIGGNIALNTRCSYFNQSQSWLASFEPCFKRGGTSCHAVPGDTSCHAYFAGDIAVMLTALKAFVTVMTANGARQQTLESLYSRDGKNPIAIQRTGVISEILIPVPESATGTVYRKLRLRQAIDFPLVSAAVCLTLQGKQCTNLRIVLGAVGPGPVVVEQVEDLVRGGNLTKKACAAIASQVAQFAKPVANAAQTPTYRRRMASVLAVAALEEARKQIHGGT
jgi:4-hydroxybenzoyl-CoA reductase subunit beta